MDTIEIVVAKWSGPALAAQKQIERWIEESEWSGQLKIFDHEKVGFTYQNPRFQGWGECRLNQGPWMLVEELLSQLD